MNFRKKNIKPERRNVNIKTNQIQTTKLNPNFVQIILGKKKGSGAH
jgi:hypothetical protein